MLWVPILVMDAILLTISIVLAIANKLLINYGECKLTLRQDGEDREFTVEGGTSLMHSLQANGVEISASCAGKASCGYCKVRVLAGGGPVLPTEDIFLTREERFQGVRLSCQVKVKEDVEILIPDFLTTVRGIVGNKLYDPRLKWRFSRNGLFHDLGPMGKVPFEEQDEEQVRRLIEGHSSERASLVPLLQSINDRFKYLPETVFPLIADRVTLPLSSVYRVATFYNAFSLKPRGKHIISVCLGTACHVKGAANVVSALETELGIKTGSTCEDMLFTLEGVRCIGCCGLAPVLTVGEDVHGQMTVKGVTKLLNAYREAPAHVETAG